MVVGQINELLKSANPAPPSPNPHNSQVSDPELTEDNIEASLIKGLRVINRLVELAEDQDPYTSLLSKRANPRH